MENEEIIKLAVHRFGVAVGAKALSSQLRREMRDHENTEEIKQKREAIKSCNIQLLFHDQSQETRKELRREMYEAKDKITQLRNKRYNDTNPTREKRRQLNDVVMWIDEERLIPALEERGMKPERDVSKNELDKAQKFKEDRRKEQRSKRR